ncbi:RHS repeat-associated core domain-containing protein [Maridesulfovibrio sp.]|uniref:RHS repeat-associated core domain-containing protein n=1 Tax=Maridesulfovibrio sp. TaxID=2795000 RepID=UPI0038B3FEE8
MWGFFNCSNTGLIHFGYREYDPAIGRFISPDPLGYAGGDDQSNSNAKDLYNGAKEFFRK